MFAGFSCRRRSKANNSRASFKHCVQAGVGETGLTFTYTQQYIERNQPRFVLLEHVEGLEEGGAESDLAFIMTWLSSTGFVAEAFNTEALEYGSYCRRSRLYIVAWRSEDVTKPEIARGFLSETANVVPQPSVSDFLDSPKAVKMRQVTPSEDSGTRGQGQSDQDHADLFVEAGWTWPLSKDRFVHEFGMGMLHLSQRAREVVWLANFKWPMPPDAKASRGLCPLQSHMS